MSASSRLTRAFKRALEHSIKFNNQDKFIIFSDTHRGTNDLGDDFAHNQLLFFHALTSYYEDGFTYIENGDGDELSENWRFEKIRRAHSHVFWLMKQFYDNKRLIMIYGNHDALRRYPGVVRRTLYTYHDDRTNQDMPLFDGLEMYEGVVLEHEESGKKIFITHGHQADWFNSILWGVGIMFLPAWKTLAQKTFGLKDPTSPAQVFWKKNKVEKNLIEWAKANNQIIIAGHTHRSMHPLPGEAPYFNSGSCVHPRAITGVEIRNGTIALVKWWRNTKRAGADEDTPQFSRMDRAVYIDRKLLMNNADGSPMPPIPLEDAGIS